ncbi:hypothetical protein ACFE04_019827 [Oxalis oulophora]
MCILGNEAIPNRDSFVTSLGFSAGNFDVLKLVKMNAILRTLLQGVIWHANPNDSPALLEFFMTVNYNHAKIWQNGDKITVNSTDLLSDFIKIDSNSPTARSRPVAKRFQGENSGSQGLALAALALATGLARSTMRKIDNSFEVNC